MLNLTPKRWKASAKVEQNLITTKHTTNFFYAKTKIIPEMAKFDMQKWQNKESLIERHPPRSPIRHFIRFFFFSTNQAIPPYTRATLRKTAKNNEKHNTDYLKKKESEAKGTHYI